MADTREVTQYLRRRFGQERIYLMGHSGGSFLGIQVAARSPELFHAYIGVSQVANQLRSEQRAYDYILAQYRASGDLRMVRRLKATPVTAHGITGQQVRDHLLDHGLQQLGDLLRDVLRIPSVKLVQAGLTRPDM